MNRMFQIFHKCLLGIIALFFFGGIATAEQQIKPLFRYSKKEIEQFKKLHTPTGIPIKPMGNNIIRNQGAASVYKQWINKYAGSENINSLLTSRKNEVKKWSQQQGKLKSLLSDVLSPH